MPIDGILNAARVDSTLGLWTRLVPYRTVPQCTRTVGRTVGYARRLRDTNVAQLFCAHVIIIADLYVVQAVIYAGG